MKLFNINEIVYIATKWTWTSYLNVWKITKIKWSSHRLNVSFGNYLLKKKE